MDAILNGPAMAPPPGETSNFSNPPNENPMAIGVLVTMIVISTICVLVRLYARCYLLRKIQAEESEYFALLKLPTVIFPTHTTNNVCRDEAQFLGRCGQSLTRTLNLVLLVLAYVGKPHRRNSMCWI